MKKVKVVGKVRLSELKARMLHDRERRFNKPLTFNLGKLLKAKGL